MFHRAPGHVGEVRAAVVDMASMVQGVCQYRAQNQGSKKGSKFEAPSGHAQCVPPGCVKNGPRFGPPCGGHFRIMHQATVCSDTEPEMAWPGNP